MRFELLIRLKPEVYVRRSLTSSEKALCISWLELHGWLLSQFAVLEFFMVKISPGPLLEQFRSFEAQKLNYYRLCTKIRGSVKLSIKFVARYSYDIYYKTNFFLVYFVYRYGPIWNVIYLGYLLVETYLVCIQTIHNSSKWSWCTCSKSQGILSGLSFKNWILFLLLWGETFYSTCCLICAIVAFQFVNVVLFYISTCYGICSRDY